MLEHSFNHNPEVILLTGLNIVLDPKHKICSTETDNYLKTISVSYKNLDFCHYNLENYMNKMPSFYLVHKSNLWSEYGRHNW